MTKPTEPEYRPLDWDEDWDDDDNVQWEAAGTVYSVDDDGGAIDYRVCPKLIRSQIIWKVTKIHIEVEYYAPDFESVDLAKEFCEQNNREHFDDMVAELAAETPSIISISLQDFRHLPWDIRTKYL